jgi:hypothetical protein
LLFTSPIAGEVVVSVDATGLSTSETLVVVTVRTGAVDKGSLKLTCTLNERVSVDVEFDRPYAGPIELSAYRVDEVEKVLPHET